MRRALGTRPSIIRTLALGVLAVGLGAGGTARAGGREDRMIPIPVPAPAVPRMIVEMTPIDGAPRGPAMAQGTGCPPTIVTHTDANFDGGSFIVQAGFAQHEIAAATYTIPAGEFPIRFDLAEMIFASANTVVETTTEWSILIWEGNPQTGNLVLEVSSDGLIIPHIVMPPGTNGVNVNFLIDPKDPDQLILNDTGTHQFSIGYRIDAHHAPGSPCLTPPDSQRNAFPTTDTSGLSAATQNWIFAVDGVLCLCGTDWLRFSQLGLCQPSGDWVMRATYSSLACNPDVGACCLADGSCENLLEPDCQAQDGAFQGAQIQCQFVSCPLPAGACCFDSGCIGDQSEEECLGAGGLLWGGAESTCMDTECLGACCLPDGSCADQTETDCDAASGAFEGEFTTCAQTSCPGPTEACCFKGAGCLNLEPANCELAGGVTSGPGTVCATTICFPMGACCLPDGGCIDDASPEACEASSGAFQGDSTTCAAIECPAPAGACCFSTGFCLELTETDCAETNGAWAGFETNCEDVNENGTADACEAACPEDIDGSGQVGLTDLIAVLSAWGPCPGCPEDIDSSGSVGLTDLIAVLGAWGVCP